MEFIAEADLATQKDLYLNDHKLDGTPLFPAALGLEAIVEAAMALLGKTPTTLSDVRFASPITVAEGKGTTIRIATLRRSYSVADVTIRSSQTDFQVDHFRATCSIEAIGESDGGGAAPATGDLLRCEELYDTILFQRGRFESVQGYFEARARSSCAFLTPTEQAWFSQFLPQSLLLISPAVMDAAMHSIQACIPHKRLVPSAIEQITIYAGSSSAHSFICQARERWGRGDDFLYDLQIADQNGNILQIWKGLTLHAIAANDVASLRTPQLISNMLERRWAETAGDDSVTICLGEEPSSGRSFRDARSRRADGKPALAEHADARAWSEGVLLQLRSAEQGSCDLERVTHRDPQVWRDLLGESLFQAAVFLANERGEKFDLAATRVWSIAECLKKLGNGTAGAVTFETSTTDGWAIVRAGDYLVGTVPINVSKSQTIAAFAARSANTGMAPVEVRRAIVSL
jgi:enediyne polyketide synthase